MSKNWFDSRAPARDAFLACIGWAGSVIEPVGADCAFRRYVRLRRRGGGQSVILMEAVPDGHEKATPGHKISDFVRIGRYLRAQGLFPPEIYEADEAEGYVLLEDFGAVSFKDALDSGVAADNLYGLATDILVRLRALDYSDINLPDYYSSHVHTGRRRLIDWYAPCALRRVNLDGLVEDYLAVWDDIERSLPPVPRGFLHIDYHFENLMWRPDQDGLARAGLLDFQGAMSGPVPYDLANLLEDARVDVPAELRQAMMTRFCASMDAEEKALFKSWYRVLATQFHCRVAGQFIKLALQHGKPQYLAHLPRVQHYIESGLNDPVLAPLQKWLAAHNIYFDSAPDIRSAYIRSDAF